ncbi:inositol oxygenase 1 [Podospora fimiseda]|uniref:Inositol oxygenase n=1 Tax=Podospora fimiseda TaxID=252190 RepID=A0AAN7BVD4_9PEZI|nr:inositol oxygenase 1 [Podospora fimiseda]
MAPHATDLTSPSSTDFTETTTVSKHKDGAALDAISDAVDTVNQLRGALLQDSPRYDTPIDAPPWFTPSRDPDTFRQYQNACERVKLFYAEQHAKQTVAYNLAARARFHSAARARPEMTIWQAIEKLDTLVDDSDPDTELSQIQHLLQSAEAIRKDGKPRWMQLTGLLHDLGKLMFLLPGCCSGQWDVVGDTFPVGCQFNELCIFPREFETNPDFGHEIYSTKYGVYEVGCGMDKLMMSWGHDEYLYLVLRDQSTLPKEALAMVRYHSFYAWHKEGAYGEFMAEGDEELLRAVRAFNPYDLYSKGDEVPNVEELKPYYLELIDEYFPNKVIKW